jgi:hypothetical protein
MVGGLSASSVERYLRLVTRWAQEFDDEALMSTLDDLDAVYGEAYFAFLESE